MSQKLPKYCKIVDRMQFWWCTHCLNTTPQTRHLHVYFQKIHNQKMTLHLSKHMRLFHSHVLIDMTHPHNLLNTFVLLICDIFIIKSHTNRNSHTTKHTQTNIHINTQTNRTQIQSSCVPKINHPKSQKIQFTTHRHSFDVRSNRTDPSSNSHATFCSHSLSLTPIIGVHGNDELDGQYTQYDVPVCPSFVHQNSIHSKQSNNNKT